MMTIDTTNMCSHLQKKLFEEDGAYHRLWIAMQDDPELAAVVRSRQLHIYRNGKKVLVLATSCNHKKQEQSTNTDNMESTKGKVIGIGGVFFKSQDPEKTKQWYEDHLGIENGPYGHIFAWYLDKDGKTEGQTVWTPFEANTDYFGDNDMMINYIVDDMDAIVERLRADSVKFVDEVTEYEGLGKFVHIEDGEGRRVELWEPGE